MSFDFLMFVPNLPTGERARYLIVSNNVSGIGVRPFANNATFGSAHRLQGIVDVGIYAIYSGRRSIVFEGPILHELMQPMGKLYRTDNRLWPLGSQQRERQYWWI